MSAPQMPTSHGLIAQQFALALGSVMAAMAPEPTQAQLEDVPEGSAGETRDGWLWWALAFDIAPEAPISIGAPVSAWQALTKLILGDDGSAETETEGVSKDLVNQCASLVAQWLSGQSHCPVACRDATPGGPGESEPKLAIDLKLPEAGDAMRLLLSVPAALEATAAPAPAKSAAPVSALAGIVLPVEVILGKVTMQLSDVLKLTVGSMLDLEHHVAEPIELVVNGQVVAWGQMVVCAGNYGLKVTAKAKAREAA